MRDSRRRNRNIGTGKAGHGSNNKLTIPDRWSDLAGYWEKLATFVAVEKSLFGRTVTYLIEPPRTGCVHHCTVQDVQIVLEMLPEVDVEQIELIIFRQPTKKQSRLAPVWGRLGYWSEIGKYSGAGIYLESQPPAMVLNWEKSLKPYDVAELGRLRDAGFVVSRNKRGFDIRSTPGSIRANQLYHTIPHEIGHYVDYLQSIEELECGDDCERFWELYDAKSTLDKEVFASRYADEFRHKMECAGRIPFPSQFDENAIRGDRLKPGWFA